MSTRIRQRMIDTPLRVERQLNDEQGHFRSFFDAHFRLVWISLGRLGVYEPDLPELTQQVFLEAYRRQAELRDRVDASVWLCEICRAIANQYVPTGPTEARASIASHGVPEASENASGYTVDRSLHRQHMDRILNKLTSEQRLVFILFELDELSGVEIGALLGIGLQRVHRVLHSARATFRRDAAHSVRWRAPREGQLELTEVRK